MFRLTKFTIDGFEEDCVFEGYTDNTHWNGWEKPNFTKEVADMVIARTCSDDEYKGSYNEETDTYGIVMQNEEIDLCVGFNIMVKGEAVHVYGIGAGSWVWDEVDEPTEEGEEE